MTDITPIVTAVIAIVCSCISIWLIPYLQSRISAAKLDEVAYWVGIAVNAVEQTMKGEGRGAEKKAAVLAFLEERGITYDPEAVDKMIEAQVHGLIGWR